MSPALVFVLLLIILNCHLSKSGIIFEKRLAGMFEYGVISWRIQRDGRGGSETFGEREEIGVTTVPGRAVSNQDHKEEDSQEESYT